MQYKLICPSYCPPFWRYHERTLIDLSSRISRPAMARVIYTLAVILVWVNSTYGELIEILSIHLKITIVC